MCEVRPPLRLDIKDEDPYQYIIQCGLDETIHLNASLDYVLSDNANQELNKRAARAAVIRAKI